MTTLNFNQFKSTTVKGNFHNTNDTVNNIPANAIIDNDLTVGGNITIGGVDLLTMLISDYVTQIDFQTLSLSLNNYQLTSNMIDYVTTSNLLTMLSSYALTTSFSNYVTNSSLTTTLTNYVTNTNLNSTLTNYVTNSSLYTSLSNSTINYNAGIKYSNYPTSSIGDSKMGYEMYWNQVFPGNGQTDLINYSQAGGNGGLTISTLKTNTSGNTPNLLFSTTPNSTQIYNRLTVPSITLNGTDLQTTLSTFLTSTPSLTGYANLSAALNTFTGNMQINGEVTIGSLCMFESGLNTSLIYYNDVELSAILESYSNLNAPLNDFSGACSFQTLSTFYGGINTDAITLLGVDLNYRLNTYITSTSLNTILSNYVTNITLSTNYVSNTNLNSTLNNLTIPQLTFNNSVSVKHLMLYNSNANSNFNNFCISIESNIIRYNVNSPDTDCHVFSSANNPTNANGYIEMLRLKTSESTFSNKIVCPTLSVSGNTNLNTLSVSGSSNINTITVSGNATFNGYIKKKVTYINIAPDQTAYSYYMAANTITPYYFVGANNATNFGFYCSVPPPDDGIEIVIKNMGSYGLNVYNIIPNGLSSTPINYVINSGFQLKVASFNGNWYQII
jgi:hypothetical protein